MVDIWWYGQACFKIKGKKASVVLDPYDAEFTGLSPIKLDANIVCITHNHGDHNDVQSVKGVEDEAPFVVSGPGEYEKLGVNIVGIASYHDNQEGAERGKNTIYSLTIDEINIVHLGDLGQKKLTQEQVEQLSSCDILLIPAGGVFTIEAKDAPDIIAQIEPKIVVPMHYKVEGLKFDLDPVDKFLTGMGKGKKEPVNKISVACDRLPQEIDVVVLEKQR